MQIILQADIYFPLPFLPQQFHLTQIFLARYGHLCKTLQKRQPCPFATEVSVTAKVTSSGCTIETRHLQSQLDQA